MIRFSDDLFSNDAMFKTFIVLGIICLLLATSFGYYVVQLDNNYRTKCEQAGGVTVWTQNNKPVCLNPNALIGVSE